jgi:hypothetical protein
MTNTLLISTKCLTAIACVLGFAVPGPAQVADADANILGAWDVSVSAGQGPSTSAPLVLKKDGEQIVGTFSTPQGDQNVEASVKEKAVTIWFSVRTQDGPINITMTGTTEGDTMKGSMDYGGRENGQWLARRAAALAVPGQADAPPADVSGTWSFQVETGAGSGTPTMTFKQDGGKLTGHYSGQLGEAPLTGTVKGNAVEFSFDASIQGTDLHVVYSGTAEKDSMKGTVKLGDVGEGTFTAKKKS